MPKPHGWAFLGFKKQAVREREIKSPPQSIFTKSSGRFAGGYLAVTF
jgi:hypothetical protein